MKKSTKTILIFLVILFLVAALIPWITLRAKSRQQIENAVQDGRRRIEASETLADIPTDTLEGRIEARLVEAWANWKPDYEGWIAWSDDLYASDATINAIGGEQDFRDYQKSMRHQRETYTMEMGPIETIEVEDNVATITYNMYLTTKRGFPRTVRTVVTEVNTFEEIGGKLTVIRLDLSTSRK